MSRARDNRKKEQQREQPQAVGVSGATLKMFLTGLTVHPVGTVDGIPEPVMAYMLASGDLTVTAYAPAATADAVSEGVRAAGAEAMRLASGLVVPQSQIIVPGQTG